MLLDAIIAIVSMNEIMNRYDIKGNILNILYFALIFFIKLYCLISFYNSSLEEAKYLSEPLTYERLRTQGCFQNDIIYDAFKDFDVVRSNAANLSSRFYWWFWLSILAPLAVVISELCYMNTEKGRDQSEE